ncbi:nucleophile aminohydrolase [Aspergillus floccosus]
MVGHGTTGMLGEDGIHVDMNHLKSGEVKYLDVSISVPYVRLRWMLMDANSTSMAINFKDGVILGADSRTTTGAYIANRVTDKLTQVHDTIWCCRSGSAADTQAVADIVSYHLNMYAIVNNEAPSTQVAASLFQELCYENKDMLSAGIIIAGYDPRHGGQVYSIPLGGSLHKQAYSIGGSGSTYIYGYCDANWRENMTEEEGIQFVRSALQEAIKWDGSSGGVIRMVVLTAKGAVRHLYLPDTGYTGPGVTN